MTLGQGMPLWQDLPTRAKHSRKNLSDDGSRFHATAGGTNCMRPPTPVVSQNVPILKGVGLLTFGGSLAASGVRATFILG